MDRRDKSRKREEKRCDEIKKDWKKTGRRDRAKKDRKGQ